MAVTYAQLKNKASGSSSVSSGGKISSYAQLRKAVSPSLLEETRKRLTQRDEEQKKQDDFKRVQEETLRLQQEADKANNYRAKAGEFIFGGGLKELGKTVTRGLAKTGLTILDTINQRGVAQMSAKGQPTSVKDAQVFGEKVESPIAILERKADEGTLTGRELSGLLGEAGVEIVSTFVAPSRMFKFLKGSGFWKNVGRGAIEGGAVGYGFDVATDLQDKNKSAKEVLTPGMGTAVGLGLGVGLPVTGATLSGATKVARNVVTKVEKSVLRKSVNALEEKIGRLDVEEIAMVNEGLKQNLDDDALYNGIKTARETKIADDIEIKVKPEPAGTVLYRGQVEGGNTASDADFFTKSKKQAEEYAELNKDVTGKSEVIAEDLSGKTFKPIKQSEMFDALEDKSLRDVYDGLKFTKPDGEEYFVRFKQADATEKLAKQGEAKAIKEEIGTSEPELTYKSTIGTQKLAQGVRQKAIKEKLIYGFDKRFRELPEYDKVTVKEQAEKATDLVLNNYDEALAVALGKKRPQGGLLPESVFTAVEQHAIDNKNIDVLRRLATESGLTGEATQMGQRLRMLAERNPESAVSNMQDVVKARAKAVEKKTGKTTAKAKEETAKEIKSKIKQSIPTKQDWSSFIDSIKC